MKSNKINIISVILLVSITIIVVMSFTGKKVKKYEIEILQDGNIVPIIDNTVHLEKREFKIRVTLNDQDGVYMSASFNRDYFDLRNNQRIKDYEWLNTKARAETKFNEAKELIIDEEMVSYLFYDKKMDWHRFDKDVILDEKKAIGTKTINKIRVQGTNEAISLTNINKNIYLFFVATEEWGKGKEPKELGRLKIEIKWK